MGQNFEIIVFSHLRWDFVYQRPQHLLSRLASRRRVIFIEEPVFDAAPHWERLTPEPNIFVYRPHTPASGPGFSESQIPYLKILLKELIEKENLENCVVWFYTPMALPLAQE